MSNWFKNIFKTHEHQCQCQAPAKSLSAASSGTSLRIECLHGEEGTCERLREMGFCESSVVEKIVDSGALICKVCDSKVVLSQKIAENIMVKDVCQMKGHQRMEQKRSIVLSQMGIGQIGIIEDFTVDSEDSERIQEMGLTPGEEIQVIRYAPLGDPIEIKIRGYNLSLRKQEADQIKVALPK